MRGDEKSRIKVPTTGGFDFPSLMLGDGEVRLSERMKTMKIAKTCCCALAVTLCMAAWAATPQKAAVDTKQTPSANHAGRMWIDIGGKDVEGRGWSDTELPFDRIPKRFAKELPRV